MRCHWDGDELMISFYPHTHSHLEAETDRRAPQTCVPRPARPSVYPTFPLRLLTLSSFLQLGDLGCLHAALLGTAAAGWAHLLLRHTSTSCIPCCLAKVGHGVISWSQVDEPWSPNFQRPIIFIDQPQPLGMAPILPAGSRQVVGAQEATLRPPAPGWGSHYGQVGGGCTASS